MVELMFPTASRRAIENVVAQASVEAGLSDCRKN